MEKSQESNFETDIPIEQLTFEAAFSQLEGVVTILETEENSLENALALFERGQSLSRHCAGLLDRVELRVKILSNNTLTHFDQETESA